MKKLKMRSRLLILVALAVVLSAATYGFAAANTVPDGVAGEGFGAISGYEVLSVVYTLDSGDPTQFASVILTLDANATDVYAGLGNGLGTIYWTSCGGGPTVFTCGLGSSTVNVHDAVELHVSAAQ